LKGQLLFRTSSSELTRLQTIQGNIFEAQQTP